jgi:hypothetical protein
MSQRRTRTQRRALTASAAMAVAGSLAVAIHAFGASFIGGHTGSHVFSALRISAAGKAAPALGISARPAHLTVAPGAAATYRLRVSRGRALAGSRGPGRHRLAAQIRLRVARPLPTGVSAIFTPPATRSPAAKLTLRASSRTRLGTYRVRVEARGRLHPASHERVRYARTVVTLVVARPSHTGFAIHGTVAVPLAPGISAPLDLSLTNPHGFTLKVRRLDVRVAAIRAPHADATHPCSTRDFAVAQFSGAYGFAVPRASTRRLSRLRIAASRWPRVAMTNRPVDQDGCKRASLTLRFTGTAIAGHT